MEWGEFVLKTCGGAHPRGALGLGRLPPHLDVPVADAPFVALCQAAPELLGVHPCDRGREPEGKLL